MKAYKTMAFLRTIDAILLVYFILIIFFDLVVNTQVVFSSYPFPKPLADLLSWYIRVFGDHLVADKPYFLRGLLASGILVNLPLCIANIYAVTTKKTWFGITSVIQGVSAYTTLVAILSEYAGQGKAPARLFVSLAPFVVFALLAVFRGVVPVFMKNASNTSTTSAAKKKA